MTLTIATRTRVVVSRETVRRQMNLSHVIMRHKIRKQYSFVLKIYYFGLVNQGRREITEHTEITE
jgi:hypothetical protein